MRGRCRTSRCRPTGRRSRPAASTSRSSSGPRRSAGLLPALQLLETGLRAPVLEVRLLAGGEALLVEGRRGVLVPRDRPQLSGVETGLAAFRGDARGGVQEALLVQLAGQERQDPALPVLPAGGRPLRPVFRQRRLPLLLVALSAAQQVQAHLRVVRRIRLEAAGETEVLRRFSPLTPVVAQTGAVVMRPAVLGVERDRLVRVGEGRLEIPLRAQQAAAGAVRVGKL